MTRSHEWSWRSSWMASRHLLPRFWSHKGTWCHKRAWPSSSHHICTLRYMRRRASGTRTKLWLCSLNREANMQNLLLARWWQKSDGQWTRLLTTLSLFTVKKLYEEQFQTTCTGNWKFKLQGKKTALSQKNGYSMTSSLIIMVKCCRVMKSLRIVHTTLVLWWPPSMLAPVRPGVP